LLVWSLILLGVGGYLTEGLRILGTSAPDNGCNTSFETVSFVGWSIAETGAAVSITPAMAEGLYWFAWWSHALLAPSNYVGTHELDIPKSY